MDNSLHQKAYWAYVEHVLSALPTTTKRGIINRWADEWKAKAQEGETFLEYIERGKPRAGFFISFEQYMAGPYHDISSFAEYRGCFNGKGGLDDWCEEHGTTWGEALAYHIETGHKPFENDERYYIPGRY